MMNGSKIKHTFEMPQAVKPGPVYRRIIISNTKNPQRDVKQFAGGFLYSLLPNRRWFLRDLPSQVKEQTTSIRQNIIHAFLCVL